MAERRLLVNMNATRYDPINLGLGRNLTGPVPLNDRACQWGLPAVYAKWLHHNRSTANTLTCTGIGISSGTHYQVGRNFFGNTCRTFRLILVVLTYWP